MQKQAFNQDWCFTRIAGYEYSPPASAKWQKIDLPHDWSVEYDRAADNPSGVSNGFFEMGRAWYQKEFQLSRFMRNRKVFVEFEGIYMNAEVWLNENLLVRHPYGYTSFTVDLTPFINYDEVNTLSVKVDNESQLNSRWYSGSGIYRPVWLLVTDKIHIGQYGVSVTTPRVSQEEATINAQTVVFNETNEPASITLRTAITAPDGSQAGVDHATVEIAAQGQATFDQNFQVETPALWSIESPNLYKLSSEVVFDQGVTDICSTNFGIRRIEFSAEEGFLLNAKPILLKGGCVHHDNGVLGAASYRRSEERKVELLKASGFNAIRCAHNPPAPAMLDACDRLGMLVMDEAFDCWRIGKNHHDYHVSFDDWWQRDLDSMLLRDRNHPSIIMWSIGNEILERDGRSNGEALARMLVNRVHEVDPTRPVTAAICGVWDEKREWEDTDVVFNQLDVGGYNYQWEQYEGDHERNPERVMVGTESFPLQALDNWQMVEKFPHVIGDFVWTSLDYLGESGIGRVHYGDPEEFSLGSYPWHQANCGDIDICGFKRPQSYYRDMIWGVGEKLYIAVQPSYPEDKIPVPTRWGWPDVWSNWNWQGHDGETFQVDVYSSCEKVELQLNGRPLGVQSVNRLTAHFEVVYEGGELKAIGYDGDEVTAEKVLQTTSAPINLRLIADRSGIDAHDPDLCYITVEVVDAEGRVVPDAENNIFFTTQGVGKIIAIGNSNPVSEERYTGNQHKAFRGHCLVVVKSTGQGPITLRAQADGLETAEIHIQAI